MKLLIDSKIVEDLPSSQSFGEYCQNIMQRLLAKNRSIGSCKIDGKNINSVEDANQAFPNAQSIEIESIPLHEAVETAVSTNMLRINQLQEKCDALVTDCLLAEPLEIAQQWQDLCTTLIELIAFLPTLGYVLTDEQVTKLADQECQELQKIMKDVAEVFPKADVVSFSDILEMRLSPWLKTMKELFQTVLKQIEPSKS